MTAIATHGKYGQVPHVVFDRCDLSAEVKWTFATLYRELWYTNGVYSGSYGKLAEQLRLTKNKTYRMVKALETAQLLSIDDKANKLTVTLNTDLWILNGLYEIGIEVPYWKNLTDALDTVLKIERSNKTIASLDLGSVLSLVRLDLNLEQIVLFLERFGLNLERFGLFLERLESAIKKLEKPSEKEAKRPPVISNGNNNHTNRQTPSQKNLPQNGEVKITLTEEEQKVHDLYSQLWFIAIPPKITDKLKGQWTALAPKIKTKEDMESLERFSRQELKDRGIETKIIHPGNLVSSLNNWIQSKGPKEPIPFPQQQKPRTGRLNVTQQRLEEERLTRQAIGGN